MSVRALVLLLVIVSLVQANAEESLAPFTVVVFNSNVAESEELAKFYAQKRGIARDHVIGIDGPREEEITRQDYDRTIAEPLRKIFRDRQWWTMRESEENATVVIGSTIRFVALMKGVPLKIRGAESYPGDQNAGGPIAGRNEASVDSELAVLGRLSPQISGIVGNPFFQSYRAAIEGI